MIDSYKKAIEFEFNQELLYKNLFKVNGKSVFIPRSFVYKEFFIKYSNLIDLIYWPLILVWNTILQPLFSTYIFIKLLPLVVFTRKKSLHNNLYIELSDIKYFTFIDKNDKNYPTQRLICPFYKTANRFKSDLEVIKFEEAISISTYLSSYLKCIFFSWRLLFTKYSIKSLYSYTCFSYILVYELLRKNDLNNIWLSNHYDRWVVLASTIKNTKTTLVQHGQLDYFNINEGKYYKSNFPFKLTNVVTIYTQNKESIELYKDFVSETNCNYKIVESKVNFIEWRALAFNKIKVLFIGHANDSTFHGKLIDKIYSLYSNSVDIAYKYHPLQMNKIANENTWHIISGLSLPIADLVVSYGSSIDAEFKEIRSVTVYNYAYEDNTDVDKVFSEILDLKLLNSINLEKAVN
jgi:hypothetical protein